MLNAAGVKATFFVVATGYNEKYLPLIADAAAAATRSRCIPHPMNTATSTRVQMLTGRISSC